jgi:hypothetical protein
LAAVAAWAADAVSSSEAAVAALSRQLRRAPLVRRGMVQDFLCRGGLCRLTPRPRHRSPLRALKSLDA